jgi:hypothetical protein
MAGTGSASTEQLQASEKTQVASRHGGRAAKALDLAGGMRSD